MKQNSIYREMISKSESGSINLNRYGTVFRTDKNYYFYDTGTGKVLRCEKPVYQLLKHTFTEGALDKSTLALSDEEIEKAFNDIDFAIEKEKILSAKEVKNFRINSNYTLTESFNHLQQICLELTERCNLRCEYCIYHDNNDQFRNYGTNDMSIDTAKLAIDYLMEHSDRKAYIAFYGGEPLLKFELIKQCVEYATNHPKAPEELKFTMTTNGTLMTKKMAQFFASLSCFNIVFSFDGDKKTHNRYRKSIDGTGSFDDAFRGYRYAVEAYGERAKEFISINTVIAPPYSSDTFDRMQSFFDREMKDIIKQYSYVMYPESNDESYDEKIRIMQGRSEEEWQPLMCWQKNNPINREKLFTWNSTTRSLLIIHKRRITPDPQDYKFNGCCVPGARKLYVTTNGDFKVCERIGEAPNIGNVIEGLNPENIKRFYIEEYENKSLKDCENCWAINLCGVCYALCYDKYGINVLKKKVACEEQRYSFIHDLEYYHQLLEDNPESLDYLNYQSIY